MIDLLTSANPLRLTAKLLALKIDGYPPSFFSVRDRECQKSLRK